MVLYIKRRKLFLQACLIAAKKTGGKTGGQDFPMRLSQEDRSAR
jgi:hypothetical protein